MVITREILGNKISELMPGISPEILNKTCDDPGVQPFLDWLCKNVGTENILHPDEIKLAQHIKKKGEWLEGEELNAELREATKDCPELMRLVNDNTDDTRLANEVETLKDDYKQDVEYLRTLGDNLKILRELEMKLDDDTETEETMLEKDRIQLNKTYADCIGVLEEFDSSHRQFFKDIECLIAVYAEAIENKTTPVVWTQLPLDLLIKQLELHNDCLAVYVKRHFDDKVEKVNDSDYDTLNEDGKTKTEDDTVYELMICQQKVIKIKIDEINMKIEESVGSALASHANILLNNGSNKIPQSETQLRVEIAALTSKRDFLLQNVALIRETQLDVLVRKYARMVITKILVNDGHARLARKKLRLEKLENLRMLAREKGHAYSDLLCILMQLQLRRIKEIVEFVADARHYLATEYSLSSVRSEIMQQQQKEYDNIMKSSPSEQNVFNKILTSLLQGMENLPNSSENLNALTEQYDKLVDDVEKRKKYFLGVYLDKRINDLSPLQDAIMSKFEGEIQDGLTKSFKPTPCELLTRLEESKKSVSEMQESVERIRAKMKDMSRKIADNSIERESTILWQRFLADPEELQRRYDEAMKKLESTHFVDNLDD